MAASAPNPVGFSYAQAAKGRTSAPTSQPPSSKVTSGTATPANGTFAEMAPNANWAEDVESDKSQSLQKSSEQLSKPALLKDAAVERTKSETAPAYASSGVSSPDLAASSTTATDDSSSAPNGPSSDSTWETKSQASEPAWIAERKERQNIDPNGSVKGGKKESKESSPAPPPPKPVVLQDAPLPVVNPWAKRAEEAKAKTAASSSQAPKLASVAVPASDSHISHAAKSEQQRKKPDVVASTSRDAAVTNPAGEPKKANGSQAARAYDGRGNVRPGPTAPSDDSRNASNNATSTKPIQRENKAAAPPPPATDETSWPTPDIVAAEKERKDSPTEKEGDENTNDADASQSSKASKKTWKPLPVTPSIRWETTELNRPRGPAGERGGRSGHATRARGGFRGASNAPKGGDRVHPKASVDAESAQRGRQTAADRDSMPPPAKPARAVSAGHTYGNMTLPVNDSRASAAATSASASEDSASAATHARQSGANSFKPSNEISSQESGQATSSNLHTSMGSMLQKRASETGNVTRDLPTTKSASSDVRRESRSLDVVTKEWTTAPQHRGVKRGGRGRGGSREYANGHQPSSPYHSSYSDFATANQYGIPSSPSAYQSPRGSQQFGHPQQGRGSWGRGGQRAQSIPIESMYNARFLPQYAQMQQPVPNMMPGMYEQPYGFPVAAVPYVPVMEQQYLMDMVSTQIEYYFSVDNLLKDTFLRRNMDSQGFVFVDVIAKFNRIKQLTADKEVLRAACLRAESIEIRVGDDGQERIRRRDGWDRYVLPKEQRESSAQTEGPAHTQRPEAPQLWTNNSMPFRGPGNAVPYPRQSFDAAFAAMNGMSPQGVSFAPMMESPYNEGLNGGELRGRSLKSPMRSNSRSPVPGSAATVPEEKDGEPDVFSDEHMSALTVVVKTGHTRLPHHIAATRTFSNGSIDPRSVFSSDGDRSADEHALGAPNGTSSTNGGDDPQRSLSRMTSPSHGRLSPEKDMNSSEISLYWVKDKEMPVDSLPNGAALEPYTQLRFKALDQRNRAAPGNCPHDLDVLYQFWSHFLIRNFNNKMYTEFKYFAGDDMQQRRSMTGMLNLIQFYAKALASSNPMRDRVVKDYVELVRHEPASLEGQAFKQLRSAWRNGALNLKNRKKLTDVVDDRLRERLES